MWYTMQHTDPKNATREGAIRYLEGMQATSHLAAHKIVEDIMNKEIKGNKNNQKN